MTGLRPFRLATALGLAVAATLSGCADSGAPRATPTPSFANIPYANWTNDEPEYRLYPGDELDVAVPSAPELNKTVTVQPDGRVTLPLIAPQMAADRTAPQLEAELSSAYASQLLRPQVAVTVRAQPLKVFVGGDVAKPGVYDMPGDIDALRAIIEAGGFNDTAKRTQVVIIRRGPHGVAMMRTVDLNQPFKDAASADFVPLRRFDIIFVPRTGLGELGSYMAQIRNALPVTFTYAFGSTVF
jgi:protein involved in polysaccharide export with SLBB domain